MQQGLDFIETKMSVSRDQFRGEFREGSDMLLDGALSHGYAIQARHGRIGLTDAGRRCLRDHERQGPRS